MTPKNALLILTPVAARLSETELESLFVYSCAPLPTATLFYELESRLLVEMSGRHCLAVSFDTLLVPADIPVLVEFPPHFVMGTDMFEAQFGMQRY